LLLKSLSLLWKISIGKSIYESKTIWRAFYFRSAKLETVGDHIWLHTKGSKIMDFAYGMLAGMYLTILVIAVQLRLRKAQEK
jgi:hypothetical protein